MDSSLNFTSKMSKSFCQKFKASLTNARYNLNACGRKVYFDEKSLICLLGEFYLPNEEITADNESSATSSLHIVGSIDENESSMASSTDESIKSYDQFLTRFRTTFWFTYRSNFKIALSDNTNSDCGWGCMLRCGQMMVAEALRRLAFSDFQNEKLDNDLLEKIVIYNFLEHIDGLYIQPTFSLHNMVDIGRCEHNRQPGDWFAPGATAQILRRALFQHQTTNNELIRQPLNDDIVRLSSALLQNLEIYLAKDGVICTSELDQLCSDKVIIIDREESSNFDIISNVRLRCVMFSEEEEKTCTDNVKDKSWTCSILIIIPLRLGGETLNVTYIDKLKKLLSLPPCVGLLGGRPKKSHFIVGWHHESVIYLDPHYCHESLNVDQRSISSFNTETYFCDTPLKMSFSEMDPSCAIGFMIRSRSELINFYQELLDVCTFGIGDREAGKNPVFSVLFSRAELDRPRKKMPNQNLKKSVAK